ncbi:uncharacterized protein BP5553_09620 [Venustampulla echinocandica]|uniref:BTB domain-containing protein n=1 Tax=Venustampulla echinocandica TaxID=2656787 RepID=A0A370TBH9_9HELO|nr:uncharacterized protein BP5553_09620 [Venustampulla echinocandica]RDL31411.1 hypothetical protein BP5553_09620 [Venustampulla echinocandica]
MGRRPARTRVRQSARPPKSEYPTVDKSSLYQKPRAPRSPRKRKMAPQFREEHILMIAPGSKTTLAQLGLPDSYTPASHRFPTRVFLAPDGKTYEPYRVVAKKKETEQRENGNGAGEVVGAAEEDEELIEYPDDDEGAIWPIEAGRIVNKSAFFALLQHIHNSFSPALQTVIILVGDPAWTSKDYEDITRFIFEKFRTPALTLMESGLAVTYGYGAPNATVIDVGYEKVDVTVIADCYFAARGSVHHHGGEGMTKRLLELLEPHGFTYDMAEQLKKSPICEILPPGVPLPGTEETDEQGISNPAAAASTGALASGPTVKITEAPRVPGGDTEAGDDDYTNGEDKLIEDEGVLDVASIVASGKTQEFLAKKEKEKAEKAAAKKATKEREAAEAAAARPQRLPNSRRPRATFFYEEKVKDPSDKPDKSPEDVAMAEETAATEAEPAENGATATDEAPAEEQKISQKKDARRKMWEEENPDRTRRGVEIGVERFQAAPQPYIDRIADTVYRVVMSVADTSKRQECWDNLIICGNGSKVRGFKEALMTTLNGRYLVSPSSATMFMSELPSNIATPSGTGSMTPNASFSSTPHPVPTASAVNPLLIAATTASNPALNPNIQASYGSGPHSHSSHSQTPTSIKILTPPAYFPEWKAGFEEAVFLGAQVAGRTFYIADQGASKCFLSRVDYNEEGPSGIHQVSVASSLQTGKTRKKDKILHLVIESAEYMPCFEVEMPASFQEILNSRIFQFTVGENIDGKPTKFYIHEKAIAQLSEPLQKLMEGNFAEAQTGWARWDDVSKETFERFVQFAYTGDYSIPEPTKWNKVAERNIPEPPVEEPPVEEPPVEEPPVEEPPVEEPPAEEPPAEEPATDNFGWGNYSITNLKSKKGKKKIHRPIYDSPPWEEPALELELPPPEPLSSFISRSYALLAPRNSYANTCEPAKHFDHRQTYSNVLLSHASLYVLGDFRLIDSLKALALFKLHKALCMFQLKDRSIEDVVDLARYAYSEEGAGSDDGLRVLVCNYTAENALVLSRHIGFMELLGEGGQFVQDFFELEVRRC